MIVRETKDGYILVEQHAHAKISGGMARKWKKQWFLGKTRRREVELAIENHDLCWESLDKQPILNQQERKPASFIDYPLEAKISAYKDGVDDMARLNSYAALLISLHYSSFFRGKLDQNGQQFKEREEDRQEQLMDRLHVQNEELTFHFDLLQLCDNLSLYLCLNEWGVHKDKEHPWFKEGFPQQLATVESTFYTVWLTENTVLIHPYPFSEENVKVSIPYKYISKNVLNNGEVDFASLYSDTNRLYHDVTFVPLKERE